MGKYGKQGLIEGYVDTGKLNEILSKLIPHIFKLKVL